MLDNNMKPSLIPKNISKDQSKDTGMAMMLICLIAGLFTKNQTYVLIATVLLILNMSVPIVFKPVAVVWLGLSNIMGMIVSRIVLTVIFFTVLTPVAIIRRMTGSDTMRIRSWKKSNQSVFKHRNHTYCPEDMETPY